MQVQQGQLGGRRILYNAEGSRMGAMKYKVVSDPAHVLNYVNGGIWYAKELISKGTIIKGKPTSVFGEGYAHPVNVIDMGSGKYLLLSDVVIYSGKPSHSNAEGSSSKYQVLKDVNWKQLSSGQMVGHPISPNNPTSDYKQGDIITGRQVSVSYIDHSGKDPKNVTGQFIQISQNRYIPRSAVAIYSGGKPTGDKQSFSGAEMTKNINSGVLAGGITFGLLGTSIGVMLGVNTKTVVVLAGAGTAIGCFVGRGFVVESFSGADGRRFSKGGVLKSKIMCVKDGLLFEYKGAKCPKGSTTW